MRYNFSINEEKRIVTGVALRANFPILRGEKGNFYEIIFTPKTVENLMIKFMKEKHLSSVNLNHTETLVDDIYLIESFLLTDKIKLTDERFKEIEEGSWIVSYKVDNQEVWEKVKKGEFNGFSLEMSFNKDKLTELNEH